MGDANRTLDIFSRSKRNGELPDVKINANAAGNQAAARINVRCGVALVAKGELTWFAAIPGNLPEMQRGEVEESGAAGCAEDKTRTAGEPGESREQGSIEGNAPGHASCSRNIIEVVRPTIIGKHEGDG